MIKLGEELDDRFLAGSFVGETIEAFAPDLFDGAFGAEARDELVGRGVHPEETIVERVFENHPALAAVVLAANSDGWAEGDALVRDAKPGFGKCWRCVSHNLPPEIHAKEVDGAVGDDPEQRATVDVDFGDAGHAGAPPGLRASGELIPVARMRIDPGWVAQQKKWAAACACAAPCWA